MNQVAQIAPDDAMLENRQLAAVAGVIAGKSVPQINPHFRFQWEPAQQAYVLLYPEGMVKLNGSAGEILSCCTGYASVVEIVAGLQTKFPQAEAIGDDILRFLGEAHDKQWIRIN